MSENNKNRICPACRAEQPSPLTVFCSSCGASLEPPSPVPVGFSIPIQTDAQGTDGENASVTSEKNALKTSDLTPVREASSPTVIAESTQTKIESAADEKLMAFGAALGLGKKEKHDIASAAAEPEDKKAATERKDTAFSHKINVTSVKIKKNTLAKSLTLFLCSVLLLVLAFCPFAHTAVKINEKREVNLDFDVAYAARVTALTFLSYSDDEIEKTDLYKQYKRSISKVNTAKFNKYDDERLENYFKMKMELQAMSSDTPVRISMVATVVFGVIYTLICVVFFIKSTSLLIKELSNKSEKTIKRAADGAAATLWLVTAFLPLVYFLWNKFTYFGIAEMSSFSQGSGMSYGFILSAIVALVGTVLTVIFNLKGIMNKTTGRISRDSLKPLALLGIALVITASSLLPTMSIKFAHNGTSGVKTAEIYVTPSTMGELSSADVSEVADLSKAESYEDLIAVGKEATSRTGTEASAFDVFNVLAVGYGRIDVSFLYLLAIAVSVFMLAVLAFLIKNIALSAFFGARKKTRPLKLLLILLSGVNLVVYIVLCVLGKTSAYGELEYVIKVSVGIGPILIFVLSVLFVCLFHTHEEKTVDRGYDNPDVSYAPFVTERPSIS